MVPNEVNEKIITLHLLGKSQTQIARETQASKTHVGRLIQIFDSVQSENWVRLASILSGGTASLGRITKWCFRLLDKSVPASIEEAIGTNRMSAESRAKTNAATPSLQKRSRGSAITDEECKKILEMAAQGRNQAEIARTIGVSPATVYNYVKILRCLVNKWWVELETQFRTHRGAGKAAVQVARCSGLEIPASTIEAFNLEKYERAVMPLEELVGALNSNGLDEEELTNKERQTNANSAITTKDIEALVEAINALTAAILTAPGKENEK